MLRTSLLAGLALPLFATGCSWEEGLAIQNMSGTVVIPREAATRDVIVDDTIVETTDVALIGPVYLGLYASIQPENTVQRYPHPEVGPLFGNDGTITIGDTYPYGGTTVGNFRNACVEDMVCKVISGRFVDFDDMVDWFDFIGQPIRDGNDVPFENGELLRQQCLNRFDLTSDEEIRLTVTADNNEDGEQNELDLDFVEREDGNFEAEFLIWQQEYAENDDGQGFTLWGFMDTPRPGDARFDSCNDQRGFEFREYNENYEIGAAFRTILNRPSEVLAAGDWVAGRQPETDTYGYIYQTQDDFPELWINTVIE